jgi:hypothetical protein
MLRGKEIKLSKKKNFEKNKKWFNVDFSVTKRLILMLMNFFLYKISMKVVLFSNHVGKSKWKFLNIFLNSFYYSFLERL